jgi:hypothetical protein
VTVRRAFESLAGLNKHSVSAGLIERLIQFPTQEYERGAGFDSPFGKWLSPPRERRALAIDYRGATRQPQPVLVPWYATL